MDRILVLLLLEQKIIIRRQ